MTELTYRLPGMHCGNCEAAVESTPSERPSVAAVHVDLATKVVTVRGDSFSGEEVRAAIDAGFEVEAA
jgi:copper chaperone CopZ